MGEWKIPKNIKITPRRFPPRQFKAPVALADQIVVSSLSNRHELTMNYYYVSGEKLYFCCLTGLKVVVSLK